MHIEEWQCTLFEKNVKGQCKLSNPAYDRTTSDCILVKEGKKIFV